MAPRASAKLEIDGKAATAAMLYRSKNDTAANGTTVAAAFAMNKTGWHEKLFSAPPPPVSYVHVCTHATAGGTHAQGVNQAAARLHEGDVC